MSVSDRADSLDSLNAYERFDAAATAVLEFLNQRIGMGLWMITRTQFEDDKWVVLRSLDHGYNVTMGQVLTWSHSFCSQMVKGLGLVSRRIRAKFLYTSSRKRNSACRSRSGLTSACRWSATMGRYSARFAASRRRRCRRALRTSSRCSNCSADCWRTVLSREIKETEALREAEQAKAEANRDPLTGLFNRRGLNELLEREEERCLRYGSNAGVISLDLNGLKRVNDERGHNAGDVVLRRAALAMTQATRKSDIAARVGGDEFVVIAVESGAAETAQVVKRLREEFDLVGVSAAIGTAMRLSETGFKAAMQIADARMYEDKRSTTEKRLSA